VFYVNLALEPTASVAVFIDVTSRIEEILNTNFLFWFTKIIDFLICKQTPQNLHSGVKICGAFMAAAKHHIVIKKLIDGVEPRSKSHKNKGCVWKYGPGYLNDLVPKSLWLDSGHVYPYMWHEKENQPTDHNELKKTFPDSYAVHHWDGSWI
jgi:hypothetical protein